MKILIGNHIEDSILKMNSDDRIFSQRVLWFAHDGDIIILSTEPDRDFLKYVTSLTGVDPSTLRFYILPKGRYFGKHFDQYALDDENFIKSFPKDLKDVTNIFSMWDSPAVVRFAEKIGLSERLPGIKFFSQYGIELVNNKAYFRALSAAADIPVANGEVCHDIKEAELAIEQILSTSEAVLVKQAHNGAGVGNQLVLKNSNVEIDHVGAKHVHYLSSSPNAVKEYLEQRWDWASVNGKRPVVIEEFKANSQTIYAEFYADEMGVRHTQAGRLGYTGHRLIKEVAPLRNINNDIRMKLLIYGERLANLYHSIGYRGYLSADAVVDEEGDLIFTEMNARVGGSLHVYDSIASRVVKVSENPERTVVQYHSPNTWKTVNFEEFFNILNDLGCYYDHKTRKGVILSLPIIPEVGGYISFCIVYETESEERAIYRKIDNELSLKKEGIKI
ncbi:biotin carboxylase [Bacillus cereus]|nr:biotin carboxylase [Bacillus cereus]